MPLHCFFVDINKTKKKQISLSVVVSTRFDGHRIWTLPSETRKQERGDSTGAKRFGSGSFFFFLFLRMEFISSAVSFHVAGCWFFFRLLFMGRQVSVTFYCLTATDAGRLRAIIFFRFSFVFVFFWGGGSPFCFVFLLHFGQSGADRLSESVDAAANASAGRNRFIGVFYRVSSFELPGFLRRCSLVCRSTAAIERLARPDATAIASARPPLAGRRSRRRWLRAFFSFLYSRAH